MIFTEKQLKSKYPINLLQILNIKNINILEKLYYIILISVCFIFIFIITKDNNIYTIDNDIDKNTKNEELTVENIDMKNILQNAANKNIFIIKKETIKEAPKEVKDNINMKIAKYSLKGFLRFSPVQAIVENKKTKNLVYLKKGDKLDDMTITDINNDSVNFQYYDQTGVLQ